MTPTGTKDPGGLTQIDKMWTGIKNILYYRLVYNKDSNVSLGILTGT